MNIINKIYRTKNTLIEMLDLRNFDTEKHKNDALAFMKKIRNSMKKICFA